MRLPRILRGPTLFLAFLAAPALAQEGPSSPEPRARLVEMRLTGPVASAPEREPLERVFRRRGHGLRRCLERSLRTAPHPVGTRFHAWIDARLEPDGRLSEVRLRGPTEAPRDGAAPHGSEATSGQELPSDVAQCILGMVQRLRLSREPGKPPLAFALELLFEIEVTAPSPRLPQDDPGPTASPSPRCPPE